MQSLWMLLACLMFAIMGACVKVASELNVSLAQVVLFRGIPSVLLLLVWARMTHRTMRPKRWRPHIVRNMTGIVSMWMGFYALSHLPLSTAISLNYTSPLFIAVWMLVSGGVGRDLVRQVSVALGFLGVIAILRPSIGEDQWLPALVGLGAGCMAAAAMMQVRSLGRLGEPEWRTVFLFSCCVCLSSLVGVAIWGWQPVEPSGWLVLGGIGLTGMFGQLAMTRAFGLGSTLLTAVLQYATMIFGALLGIAFWNDIPDVLAWGGIGLIILAGLLSTWRTYTESRLMQGVSRTADSSSSSSGN